MGADGRGGLMRASSAASDAAVAITDAWRRWISETVGPRASWVRQLDNDNDWFLHPGDIPTFVSGLESAMELRKAAVLRELEARERLPRDPETRRQVLDAALPGRLAKDALYQLTCELHRLLVAAHRDGAIVSFDPYV